MTRKRFTYQEMALILKIRLSEILFYLARLGFFVLVDVAPRQSLIIAIIVDSSPLPYHIDDYLPRISGKQVLEFVLLVGYHE